MSFRSFLIIYNTRCFKVGKIRNKSYNKYEVGVSWFSNYILVKFVFKEQYNRMHYNTRISDWLCRNAQQLFWI